MKILHIQKRDNVEFYLCCKFQLSPFSVRRKTDVKDGVTDKLTNKRTTVCRGSAPRHNNSAFPIFFISNSNTYLPASCADESRLQIRTRKLVSVQGFIWDSYKKYILFDNIATHNPFLTKHSARFQDRSIELHS